MSFPSVKPRGDRVPPVTEHMLNDFTALSDKAHPRFPAAWVASFCEVTGRDELQRLLFTAEIRSVVLLGECELAAQRQQRTKIGIVKELLTGAKDRSI